MIDISRAVFDAAEKLKGPAGMLFRSMSVLADGLREGNNVVVDLERFRYGYPQLGDLYGLAFVYPPKYEGLACQQVADKIIEAVYDALTLQDPHARSHYLLVVVSTEWVADVNEVRRQKGIDLLTANTHGTQH